MYSLKPGRVEKPAEDAGKIVYDFMGKITNLSDTYPNKDNATCSASVSVNGEIEETEFVFTP